MSVATAKHAAQVTQGLAEFLSDVAFRDLPEHVVADARRTVLDWLGCALAGSQEEPARIARQVAAGLGSSDDATVFSGVRSSAAGAAFANGVATHILELDDIHKGSTIHGAAPIVPAALAVAERQGADSRALLLAVVAGYEAALRIGEAVNPSHYRYWHPTGTVATFGAATAAASLLKLDASELVHALGSAGTQAGGLWEFNADGAMSKVLHPGKAAMNGVLAADLSKLGFTGATRILEGERGFFRATSENFDTSRVLDGLGETWKISENCFKLYSCCGHTHSAIDAALDLRARLGWKGDEALDSLRTLRLHTYGPGFEIVKERNPRTPYQAKFSLAYVVAAALLEGRIGFEQFSDERFSSSGVHGPAAALLDRIEIEVSPELTGMYPAAWPARLDLTLTDGTRLQAGGDYPRGNPENPVTTKALEDKFRSLVEPRLGAAQAQRGLELIGNLGQEADGSAHLTAWKGFGAA